MRQKKRIEHPIGRSVTDSPVRMWFSPTSLGREKERTHKKQFHEWKVLVVHTCYKKLSFPCSAAPKIRTVCDALHAISRKNCACSKKEESQSFLSVLQTDVCRKKCVLLSDVFNDFFATLDLYLEVFILCGTWINHKI